MHSQLNHNSSRVSGCSSTFSLFWPSELEDWSLWEELSVEVESELSVFCSLLSVSFFAGFWILGFGLGILLILATCKYKWKTSTWMELLSWTCKSRAYTLSWTRKSRRYGTLFCRSNTFKITSSDVKAGLLNPEVLQKFKTKPE